MKGKPFVILARQSAIKAASTGPDIHASSSGAHRSQRSTLDSPEDPASPSFNPSRMLVFMCSPEAERREIRSGMRLSEARNLCADLLWRNFDGKLYAGAQNKLTQELISCSPKISSEKFGTFILDASGLKHMGGESGFCRHVLKFCSRMGFVDGRTGIADSAFAAEIATRFKRRRFCIVPEGEDATFLAPLSTWHLPASREMQEALLGLGIRTMGQLVKLPADSIVERFGAEGSFVRDLAAGIDQRHPSLPLPLPDYQCSVELGYPADSLTEIVFVIKSMLDRLIDQLGQAALQAEELTLNFFNDNDKFDERSIKLICPSNNVKFLTDTVKLSLEARPLGREVTGITTIISRHTTESWEQLPVSRPQDRKHGRSPLRQETALSEAPSSQLFISGSESGSNSKVSALPEALILLLQRFKIRLSDYAVVRPVANDQHFPENAGAWVPVLENSPATQVIPADIEYVRNYAGSKEMTGGLVIRRAPESIPVLIRFKDSSPSAVAYHGQWHQLKCITMPECLSGLWWDKFIRKSYYVAALDRPNAAHKTGSGSAGNSSLVLLVHDHQTDHWLLEGFFD